MSAKLRPGPCALLSSDMVSSCLQQYAVTVPSAPSGVRGSQRKCCAEDVAVCRDRIVSRRLVGSGSGIGQRMFGSDWRPRVRDPAASSGEWREVSEKEGV